MPRAIPPFPEDFNPQSRRSDPVSLECTVRLVTPMFGGGVKPGEPDELTPIRGTAIRGHLRFWWRATRGAAFATVDDLKKREDEIWGSTENPSPVSIVLNAPELKDSNLLSRGADARRPFGFERFSPELYAIFAAVENKDIKHLARPELAFRLQIAWPNAARLQAVRDGENRRRRRAGSELLNPKIDDITRDVEAALAAWISFGGLGSRTRRGCGSLYVEPKSLQKEMPGALPGQPAFPKGATLFFTTGTNRHDAMSAWRDAVEVYHSFRQGFEDQNGKFHFRGQRHRKTFPGGATGNVPGRSHWPEPESMRHLTGCALRPAGGTVSPAGTPADEDPHDHSQALTQVPRNLLPAFPRAVLGLPIVFHFSDGPKKRPGGGSDPAEPDIDPAGTELKPLLGRDDAGNPIGSRMASPVITKAVWDGKGWRAALLILPHHHARKMECYLTGNKAIPSITTSGGATLEPQAMVRDIANSEISDPGFGVFEPMGGHASAIDALKAFITGPHGGFREVTP